MKIICNPISVLSNSDVSGFTISLTDNFLERVNQIDLTITSDYYSSFRNLKTETYKVTAEAYLNEDTEKWSDKSLLCPEMPIPSNLSSEVTLSVPLNKFWKEKGVAFIHAGREDRIAPLHFDWDHTWVAHGCITGVKRFFLFSPEAGWLLNPIINTSSLNIPRFSEIDRKEILEKLGGIEILLQAGEGILFPSCFWHAVLYIEPSLSVSVRYEPSAKGRPFAVLPRSWYLQRLVWRFFQDEYDYKAQECLSGFVDIFFNRKFSWKKRYWKINEFCRTALSKLSEEKGAKELTAQNFSSEIILAKEELKFYYDIEELRSVSVDDDDLTEAIQYIFEAKSPLSIASKESLAFYALCLRQGLSPKRGLISIEEGA